MAGTAGKSSPAVNGIAPWLLECPPVPGEPSASAAMASRLAAAEKVSCGLGLGITGFI